MNKYISFFLELFLTSIVLLIITIVAYGILDYCGILIDLRILLGLIVGLPLVGILLLATVSFQKAKKITSVMSTIFYIGELIVFLSNLLS